MAKKATFTYTDDITGKPLREKDLVRVRLVFENPKGHGRKLPVAEFDTHAENVKDWIASAGENVRNKDVQGRKKGESNAEATEA